MPVKTIPSSLIAILLCGTPSRTPYRSCRTRTGSPSGHLLAYPNIIAGCTTVKSRNWIREKIICPFVRIRGPDKAHQDVFGRVERLLILGKHSSNRPFGTTVRLDLWDETILIRISSQRESQCPAVWPHSTVHCERCCVRSTVVWRL